MSAAFASKGTNVLSESSLSNMEYNFVQADADLGCSFIQSSMENRIKRQNHLQKDDIVHTNTDEHAYLTRVSATTNPKIP
jgi:chlorite dismutase